MNSWINEAIVYHIYPLGMLGAEKINDLKMEPVSRLDKISEWTGYFRNLGINTLYLGPLFESNTHGYDTVDYQKVDRRLGTNNSLKLLIDKLHQENIRVVLDGVFNHTGCDFFAFKDIVNKGERSEFCSWISGLDFNSGFQNGYPFRYDTWNGHNNLVKLNLKNPDTKEYLFNAVKMWIEQFNIDGIRFDAADCLDIDFIREISGICREEKNDIWLLGEIIHGDYNYWTGSGLFDSVTNYECYKGLWSSFNDENFFELAYSLNRQFGDSGLYKDKLLYSFTDNHDVDRIMSTLIKKEHIYPLYCMLFTIPGIPSIYYGSELGIKGRKDNGSDDPLRPFINLNRPDNVIYDIFNAVKEIIRIRKNSEPLKFGFYKEYYKDHKIIIFERKLNDKSVIVAVNSNDHPLSVKINIDDHSSGVLLDMLNNNEEIHFSGSRAEFKLYPNWARIMKLIKTS